MRIKIGEYIREVKKVWVRDTDISIDTNFYQTKEQTQVIAEQLLKDGYADLTDFEVR
jgi:hypothetical protein